MSKEKISMVDSAEIKAVANMVELAYNLKCRTHKKTGKTHKETMELINKLVIEIEMKLIGYTCLQAAVKLSKDNKAISKKALELFDLERELIEKNNPMRTQLPL